MALMPNPELKIKERSANSRLIVSGINSPAEDFVLDPDLPVLFEYPFGFPGLTKVVIPKGLALSVLANPSPDPVTGQRKPALTICDPESPRYVGIAPYNLCQRPEDSLTGNIPTFVRGVYIELPYIKDPVNCSMVKYGAIHQREIQREIQGNGELVVELDEYPIEPGVYVTWSRDPINKGHLTRWVEDVDEPHEIIGKVITVEHDDEPWGWFKWVMWDETAKAEDKPEPDWAQNHQPGEYKPEYRDGTIYQTGYHSPYTIKPTGIKGLTDGAYRGAIYVDFAIPSGESEFDIDIETAGGAGTMMIKNGLVKALIGGIELPSSCVKPDYENNKVTITLPWPAPTEGLAGKLIIQNKDKFIGTPPGWDYVGSIGVARIMIF